MEKHIIELKDVAKFYEMGENTVKALNCVQIKISQGEFVVMRKRLKPENSQKSF